MQSLNDACNSYVIDEKSTIIDMATSDNYLAVRIVFRPFSSLLIFGMRIEPAHLKG